MMTLKSLKPKPELEKSERRLSIKVELVTPQLGGGAEARKADPEQWLRAASVRGALRFWWRALFAGNYTKDELHAAESGIFGKAAKHDDINAPGKLAITIVIHKLAEQRLWDDYLSDDETRMKQEKAKSPEASALSVAYFPANKTKEEPSARLLSPGVHATITIWDASTVRSPQSKLRAAQWTEVLEAFRAYLLFGGSGGRTRRAAGAICVDSIQEAQKLALPATTEAIQNWITPYLDRPNQTDSHDCFLLSHCEGLYVTSLRHDSGQEAQETLLKMWRDFRQQRMHPRSWYGRGGWGKSKWPEATAVRSIIQSNSPTDQQHSAPRAHLGLPIGIKFINEEATHDLVMLAPDERGVIDRYASPVLLAVTRLFDSGPSSKRCFVGLVLITRSMLDAKQKLVLKGHPDQPLQPGDWNAVLDSPTAPLGLREILKRDHFQQLVPVQGTTK